MELMGGQRTGDASKHPDIPSVLEMGPARQTILKIENSSERGSLPTLLHLLVERSLKSLA